RRRRTVSPATRRLRPPRTRPRPPPRFSRDRLWLFWTCRFWCQLAGSFGLIGSAPPNSGPTPSRARKRGTHVPWGESQPDGCVAHRASPTANPAGQASDGTTLAHFKITVRRIRGRRHRCLGCSSGAADFLERGSQPRSAELAARAAEGTTAEPASERQRALSLDRLAGLADRARAVARGRGQRRPRERPR